MDIINGLSPEFVLHVFTLRAPEASVRIAFLVLFWFFFVSCSKTDKALHSPRYAHVAQ